MFPIIYTDRLDLIEIKQEHLPDLFTLFGDAQVVRYYNLLPFQDESEGQRIIDLFQTRFTNQTGIRWGIALKGTTNIIAPSVTIPIQPITKQPLVTIFKPSIGIKVMQQKRYRK